jgi:hypothetical protein
VLQHSFISRSPRAGLIRSLFPAHSSKNVIVALLQRLSRGLPSRLKLAPHNSPSSRLSLISRHLQHQPVRPLNTPYSIETSSIPDSQIRRLSTASQASRETVKMSSQPPHPALLIPGPIEFDDTVLQSMSHYRYILCPF